MTSYQDLPSRQKSQRIINQMKQQQLQQGQQREKFQPYKSRPKIITNIHELLPGLNDISDAFEALPLDIIKYFTLLKEIDAKCINTVPQINYHIKTYIDSLHSENNPQNGNSYNRLNLIKDKINEIIPCLEEKMHVTSVASDLLYKHMTRIDQDYKLIVQNNEIPESIRIGPLNHPAMIMDSSAGSGIGNSVDRSVPSQRSESRREALAAKKANKETDEDIRNTGNNGHSGAGRKKKNKEGTPSVQQSHSQQSVTTSGIPAGATNPNNPRINSASSNASTASLAFATSTSNNKKRGRGEDRSATPNNSNPNKRGKSKKNEYDEDEIDGKTSSQNKGPKGNEPTYCYCNQVSFGEMVGCDGEDCKREWFHLPCIGFKNPPKGKWYCDDCSAKMKKAKK